MEQIYKILTSAYTNCPLPPIKIVPFVPASGQVWTYHNFQMYKNSLFNVVIVYTSEHTTVTLVVENRVYYWLQGDLSFFSSFQNYIYRVAYPALANFVNVSWNEKKHCKYLQSGNKPFTSHLVFAPETVIGSGLKSTRQQLQMSCSLWEYEEENLYNWEMDLVKPWNVTDFKTIRKLSDYNKQQFNLVKTIEDWDEMFYKFISIKPGFTDFYYMLYVMAIERKESEMKEQLKKYLEPGRLREINRLYEQV